MLSQPISDFFVRFIYESYKLKVERKRRYGLGEIFSNEREVLLFILASLFTNSLFKKL
jgi:hypothetical protein